MAATEQIKVPDIGGATNVEVIEIQVKPGDRVAEEDALITLESEKASMDVPSPKAGKVKAIQVKVGDKVEEGSDILTLELEGEEKAQESQSQIKNSQEEEKTQAPKTTEPHSQEVAVPDIGGAADVEVIEVQVKAGDKVEQEQPLITLESEKASMDIPSPYAGKIQDVKVKVGDKVSEGDAMLTMETEEGGESVIPQAKKEEVEKKAEEKKEETPPKTAPYASPAVRRTIREFALDTAEIPATGRKGRLTKEDVQKYVKNQLQKAKSGGLAMPTVPSVDFSKYGEIETKPLNKIKKLTGESVHRSWLTIPHVTQFDEADITELETFRKSQKSYAEKQGFKLTPLVFLMKAVVVCLKQFPYFNSSLDSGNENLIIKQYYHIGIAVDTPNGLVVPVIRDVDKKGMFELAKELGDISKKAREKGLSPAEMAGSTFTISSLGGIGGKFFTPIVKAPDVAILGVSKAEIKPVYQDDKFIPRLMLPLSLSYDHRVVDGADGARFMVHLCNCLSDIRTLLL